MHRQTHGVDDVPGIKGTFLFAHSKDVVRSRRLELPLRLRNSDLNAARLPFRHDRTADRLAKALTDEKRIFATADPHTRDFHAAQQGV